VRKKQDIAKQIVETLRKNGHDAYFAGGCVRDRIRGVEPKDFDIATAARPEDIQKLFPKTVPVGVQFGVILIIEDETPFEVATFRTEGDYQDGRHPNQVAFATVEEDARRRDFTVNGLYFDPITNQVIDHVSGQADIKKKVIRTIGEPHQRFLEDHLRMFRAVRFAVQLGYEIEAATLQSIKDHAALITKVSQERLRDELTKTLTSEDPERGMRLLDETGLLPFILPEALAMKGVEQPMEYHPEGDVFIHTLLLLKQLKSPPIELAMGALLHDIAKPATFVRAPDRIRFHGHDKIGAEMSRTILKRLAFSNAQTDLICSLVAEHLRFKDAFQMRVSTLKRFLSLDRFDLHLALHKIDCMASHGNLDAHEFCTKKYEEFKQAPPPPMKLVTGADLIALGLKPSPEFTKILRTVEDAILEGTVTTKEEGLALVKKQFPGGSSA
jgi:putative nucleotidyltransferase with HDIG domain